MSQFHYEAFGPAGRAVSGVIEADSLGQALTELSRQGLKPYKTSEGQKGTRLLAGSPLAAGLPLAMRARLMRQLATLLSAGIAPDRALRLVAAQSASPAARRAVDGIAEKVVAGQSLAMAMDQTSGGFKADEIGLVRAGEHTGALPLVLGELAALLERRAALREKLVSAFVYPVFLLAMVPVTLIVIALVLVPNLKPLFDGSGAPIPAVLRLMMSVNEAWDAHGVLLVIGACGLLIALAGLFRNRGPRATMFHAMKSFPGVRTVTRKSEAARICRALGSLLRSGSALQTALAVVAEVSPAGVVRGQLESARDGIGQGEKLSRALARVPALDSNILQMIAIGEETNKLDAMLLYVADQEEQAVASTVDRFMALLTPLLTVAIGLLVGGIVMSIMRAILSINDLAAP